jgi:hypothetical protein
LSDKKAKFILYIPDSELVESSISNIDQNNDFHSSENGIIEYKDLFCTEMTIIKNESKALVILTTSKNQGEMMINQLKSFGSVIPLGCHGDQNSCDRIKPSECFCEDDWMKIEEIIPDVQRNNFIGDLR